MINKWPVTYIIAADIVVKWEMKDDGEIKEKKEQTR